MGDSLWNSLLSLVHRNGYRRLATTCLGILEWLRVSFESRLNAMVECEAAEALRNVGLLAGCQAMLLAINATLVAVNGLAGLAFAPQASLATLPVTFGVVGAAISTLPASLHMKCVGRRAGLVQGAALGIAGALLSAMAIWLENFWLLCSGALVLGAANAFGQYYRFVAADTVGPDLRASAISLVLAGGMVGGVLGPTISRYTIDLAGPRFAGAYLTLVAFYAVTIVLLARIRIPQPDAMERVAPGRPFSEVAAQPAFIVAVLAGAFGYGVMNLLMTSTPIAMHTSGHAYGDAALVISSHVVGMFAPSFITSSLIRRAGVLPVLLAGALLNAAAVAIAVSGVALAHFWWALVLLGVGWNFLYVGGTTLLAETYRPEERARAQGANELAIFTMQTMSSVTSGMIITGASWEKVNYAALPLIVVVLAGLAWFALAQRAVRTARPNEA